ncbi:hypothetical protein NGRA_2233 [Nosema granulosis]|uniref:Uncharacterized protein n=1 Tax=Nosema granulosis TaxID=83296 RepID=A0A9P6KYC6_9MICR|nr:hypothetical protein NGRA_2233 [Nosema granulosis]
MTREFKKLFGYDANLVRVEVVMFFFNSEGNIVEKSFDCEIIDRKIIDRHISELVYCSKGLYEDKSNDFFVMLIRYHTETSECAENLYCERLCLFKPGCPNSIIRLDDELLEKYIKILIYKTIYDHTSIRSGDQWLSRKLMRIRHHEMCRIGFFSKIDHTQNIFETFVSSRYNHQFRNHLQVLEYCFCFLKDFYACFIYEDGLYPDSLNHILKDIKMSKIKNQEMLKTLIRMLNDLLIISRASYYDKRIFQSGFSINQAINDSTFTIKYCYIVYIDKSLMHQNLTFTKVVQRSPSELKVKQDVYLLGSNLYIPISDEDLTKFSTFEIEIEAEENILYKKRVHTLPTSAF